MLLHPAVERRAAVAGVFAVALVFAMPAVVKADDGRAAIVERFASDFERLYVFADRAHTGAARIRARFAEHAYDALDDQAFARQVTADVNAVVHDKHVHFAFNVYPLPPQNDPSAPPSDAQRRAERKRAAAEHFGFANVRVLPGNVGYVDLRSFPHAEYTGPAMANAMQGIAGSGAIIIDERVNNGGDPYTVAMLESYFFPKGSHIHIGDLTMRDGSRKKALPFFTSDVAGPRFPKVPLYVLTSGATFSAGEAFAYDMQAFKRGTIVGQTTRGGANGGAVYQYGKHFDAFIPLARGVNAITHTNWDGVGVKPDVVAVKDTFKTAYLAALRGNLDTVPPEKRAASADWIRSVEGTDSPALAHQLHVLYPDFPGPPPGWGRKSRHQMHPR